MKTVDPRTILINVTWKTIFQGYWIRFTNASKEELPGNSGEDSIFNLSATVEGMFIEMADFNGK